MSERAEWLLYSMRELARLLHYECSADLLKLIKRIRYGIKEELVTLASLRGVGRVRARALHNAGLKTIEQLRSASVEEIAHVPKIGMSVANWIKKQVDENGIVEHINENDKNVDDKERYTEQKKLI
jgi:helicase